MVLLLTLFLWLARQPDPRPAMRVYLRKDGHIYRVWRDRQTGWRRLTTHVGQTETYRSLTWSPDGRWIAFIDYSLYRIGVQGGESKALTNSFDGAPDWSPDGTKIVYQQFTQAGDFDLAYIEVLPDEATRRGEPQLLYGSSASEFAPRWSPNGGEIAFLSTQYGSPDVFRYVIATQQLYRLTDYPRAEAFPRWSEDGQWVIYETATGQVEQVSLDGTERHSLPVAPVLDRSLSPVVDLPFRVGWVLLLSLTGILARVGKSVIQLR